MYFEIFNLKFGSVFIKPTVFEIGYGSIIKNDFFPDILIEEYNNKLYINNSNNIDNFLRTCYFSVIDDKLYIINNKYIIIKMLNNNYASSVLKRLLYNLSIKEFYLFNCKIFNYHSNSFSK